MSFSKTITLPGGTLTLAGDLKQVSATISENAAVGGGAAAGVLQVKGNASVVLSEKQAVDLAFALLEAHLPTAAATIAKEVQGFYDAAAEASG